MLESISTEIIEWFVNFNLSHVRWAWSKEKLNKTERCEFDELRKIFIRIYSECDVQESCFAYGDGTQEPKELDKDLHVPKNVTCKCSNAFSSIWEISTLIDTWNESRKKRWMGKGYKNDPLSTLVYFLNNEMYGLRGLVVGSDTEERINKVLKFVKALCNNNKNPIFKTEYRTKTGSIYLLLRNIKIHLESLKADLEEKIKINSVKDSLEKWYIKRRGLRNNITTFIFHIMADHKHHISHKDTSYHVTKITADTFSFSGTEFENQYGKLFTMNQYLLFKSVLLNSNSRSAEKIQFINNDEELVTIPGDKLIDIVDGKIKVNKELYLILFGDESRVVRTGYSKVIFESEHKGELIKYFIILNAMVKIFDEYNKSIDALLDAIGFGGTTLISNLPKYIRNMLQGAKSLNEKIYSTMREMRDIILGIECDEKNYQDSYYKKHFHAANGAATNFKVQQSDCTVLTRRIDKFANLDSIELSEYEVDTLKRIRAVLTERKDNLEFVNKLLDLKGRDCVLNLKSELNNINERIEELEPEQKELEYSHDNSSDEKSYDEDEDSAGQRYKHLEVKLAVIGIEEDFYTLCNSKKVDCIYTHVPSGDSLLPGKSTMFHYCQHLTRKQDELLEIISNISEIKVGNQWSYARRKFSKKEYDRLEMINRRITKEIQIIDGKMESLYFWSSTTKKNLNLWKRRFTLLKEDVDEIKLHVKNHCKCMLWQESSLVWKNGQYDESHICKIAKLGDKKALDIMDLMSGKVLSDEFCNKLLELDQEGADLLVKFAIVRAEGDDILAENSLNALMLVNKEIVQAYANNPKLKGQCHLARRLARYYLKSNDTESMLKFLDIAIKLGDTEAIKLACKIMDTEELALRNKVLHVLGSKEALGYFTSVLAESRDERCCEGARMQIIHILLSNYRFLLSNYRFLFNYDSNEQKNEQNEQKELTKLDFEALDFVIECESFEKEVRIDLLNQLLESCTENVDRDRKVEMKRKMVELGSDSAIDDVFKHVDRWHLFKEVVGEDNVDYALHLFDCIHEGQNMKKLSVTKAGYEMARFFEDRKRYEESQKCLLKIVGNDDLLDILRKDVSSKTEDMIKFFADRGNWNAKKLLFEEYALGLRLDVSDKNAYDYFRQYRGLCEEKSRTDTNKIDLRVSYNVELIRLFFVRGHVGADNIISTRMGNQEVLLLLGNLEAADLKIFFRYIELILQGKYADGSGFDRVEFLVKQVDICVSSHDNNNMLYKELQTYVSSARIKLNPISLETKGDSAGLTTIPDETELLREMAKNNKKEDDCNGNSDFIPVTANTFKNNGLLTNGFCNEEVLEDPQLQAQMSC